MQQSNKAPGGFRIATCALGFYLLSAVASADERTFPELIGPLMGQSEPGLSAEVFAPGVVSTAAWEVEGVFAPNMTEFYFTTRGENRPRPTVIGYRQYGDVWRKFLEFEREGEVSFSPDGNIMYTAEGYREREGDGWSERRSLGPLIDREDWGVMRLSVSTEQTFVFDDYKSGDVIRTSKLIDGIRQEPVLLDPQINTGEWTAHPFIAPDESYLIWDSERDEGFGDSDLYISFRQSDGSWGPAINMGPRVNSDRWDAFATVTADGKYILFNRGQDTTGDNIDIYWVSAQIIDDLRDAHSPGLSNP